LLFGPGLLEEYELCRNELDFDDHQMAEVALASVEASGAPAESKRSAAAGIADWLRAAHGR
jgi:adenosine deaminase